MEPGIIIAISFLVVIVLALGGLIGWLIASQKGNLKNGQAKISDRDLLLLFDEQPDGLLSKQQIKLQTGLTSSEVRSRLQFFVLNKVLRTSYTNKLKYYYSLSNPLDKREGPALSDKPFLTVADILTLFKHFDYRMSLQDICMATRLPMQVILREMKYFEKEKVVVLLHTTTNVHTGETIKDYILQEPYRSNPEKFMDLELHADPLLEKIYDELYVD
ncbi:MAG: hypothetical protein HKN16_07955 [Saprospiraceae bacterium]|nr:hypothetical protein [Saprospiraceae bacterium]